MTPKGPPGPSQAAHRVRLVLHRPSPPKGVVITLPVASNGVYAPELAPEPTVAPIVGYDPHTSRCILRYLDPCRGYPCANMHKGGQG